MTSRYIYEQFLFWELPYVIKEKRGTSQFINCPQFIGD